jgi:hypothetical protein
MKYLLLMSLVLGLLFESTSSANAGLRYTQEVKVIDPEKRYLRAMIRHPELIVDHVDRVGYEVYGPSGLQAWLQKHQIQYIPMQKPSEKVFSGYPTAEQIVAQMQELQKRFPQLIALTEIGKSTQGRPLIVAKLTAPALQGKRMRDRPEFKYIANMHGDEIAGRELMVRLIADLASGYGRDGRITRLMETTQIYILPSMNPDGANRRSRYNARNADLNRSFPDFTTSDNVNDWKNREPEVQAVMKFQAQHRFLLSANFHGGAEVVNYPWDTASEPFPLDNWVQKISLDYSREVPYMWNSSEFKNGIVNGYAWYEVNGGMQDWSYYWYKDVQVTIELTQQKWPEYSTLDEVYRLNRNALLGYIEAVHSIPTRRI